MTPLDITFSKRLDQSAPKPTSQTFIEKRVVFQIGSRFMYDGKLYELLQPQIVLLTEATVKPCS